MRTGRRLARRGSPQDEAAAPAQLHPFLRVLGQASELHLGCAGARLHPGGRLQSCPCPGALSRPPAVRALSSQPQAHRDGRSVPADAAPGARPDRPRDRSDRRLGPQQDRGHLLPDEPRRELAGRMHGGVPQAPSRHRGCPPRHHLGGFERADRRHHHFDAALRRPPAGRRAAVERPAGLALRPGAA